MGYRIRTMIASLVAASFVACAAQGDAGAVGTASDDDTSAAPAPAPTTDGLLVGPEVMGPWVYANDFTLRANPQGAWSVGTRASEGDPFIPFTLSQGVLSFEARCGAIETWSSASGAAVWKNIGGRACYGAADGQISMRPATDGSTAVIRWVAPATASYHIQLQYFAVEGTTMHAYAHIGADVLVDGSTVSSPSFSDSRALPTGAALEVAIDSPGASKLDSAPITLTIKRE